MAGKNGGARPGAGRPKLSVTVKKVDPKIINAGILPLEMRLRVARHMWDEAAKLDEDGNWVITNLDKAKAAAEFAEPALPYTSNRLSTVVHTGPSGGAVEHTHDVSAEVAELIREELGGGKKPKKA